MTYKRKDFEKKKPTKQQAISKKKKNPKHK
jgi:hypothetical protein